jgi:hypothetical protein
MRISIQKSKPFPHPPFERWAVDSHGAKFDIDVWHIATYKGGHWMRFAVKDHAFEVYFSQSGRSVNVFPIGRNGKPVPRRVK